MFVYNPNLSRLLETFVPNNIEMDQQEYLKKKQIFYANLNGTSFNEVLNLIISFSLINFLGILIKILFFNTSNFWISFSADYIFCFIPLILICTILSDWVQLWLLCSTLIVFLFYSLFKNTKTHNQNSSYSPNDQPITIDRKIIKISISTFRTWVYLLTCISILAVDFKIFPRRFAKTETYGISPMDLGVGFYIVCHSMKFIRNNASEINTKESFRKYIGSILKELKTSSILLILGILRLISVKSTNYVEHESEYGRHWNFFFTIVVVKLVATLIQPLIKNNYLKSFLIGSFIACFYQYALSYKHLNKWILHSKRDEKNLFDLNREGILSCLGYIAIYLLSQAIFLKIDSIIKKSESDKNKRVFVSSLKCLLSVALFSLIFWIIFELCRYNIENVSRRLCNLSFVCLIIMLSTMFYGLFLTTTLLISKIQLSNIIERIKKEENGDETTEMILQLNRTFSFPQIVDSKFIGLLNFFFSNIFTGMVNLWINTLTVSSSFAFFTISLYSLASFVIPLIFYRILNKV